MKGLLFFKAIRRFSSSVGRSHKAQEDPKGVWLKCGCVCKKTSPRRLQENMQWWKVRSKRCHRKRSYRDLKATTRTFDYSLTGGTTGVIVLRSNMIRLAFEQKPFFLTFIQNKYVPTDNRV